MNVLKKIRSKFWSYRLLVETSFTVRWRVKETGEKEEREKGYLYKEREREREKIERKKRFFL